MVRQICLKQCSTMGWREKKRDKENNRYGGEPASFLGFVDLLTAGGRNNFSVLLGTHQ